jgi:hypothetical protein
MHPLFCPPDSPPTRPSPLHFPKIRTPANGAPGAPVWEPRTAIRDLPADPRILPRLRDLALPIRSSKGSGW